jgi:hypothetical protein
VVSHVGGQAEEEQGHEVGAGPVVCGQQGLHLPHHICRFHVSDLREI